MYSLTQCERLILKAIDILPTAHLATILDYVREHLGPSKWLRIPAKWQIDESRLYVYLEKLEKNELIYGNYGHALFLERGHKKRLYYFLTRKGRYVLDEIRNQ